MVHNFSWGEMAVNATTAPLMSEAELVTFNIILPITSVLGLATNLIVIFGVIYNRNILRVPANIFVVNLAIADIFVVVIGVPLWIIQLSLAQKITASQSETLCQINFGLSVFTSVLSIHTLGIISYDRYAAVTKPFRYHETMSQCTTYKILAGTWLVTLMFSLPAFIGWKSKDLAKAPNAAHLTAFCVYTKFYSLEYLLIMFTGTALILVMNICLYVKLLIVAKRHARQIESTKNEVETSFGEPSTVDRSRRHPLRKERNLKAAKALGIVLGALLLCWVPFLIAAYVDSIMNPSNISVFTMKLLGTITYLNSVMNPLIYTYMSRDFRKAVRKLLPRNRGLSNFLGSST